ncbi:MAG TPA: hypothetical protein VE981_19380 [Planctomycetota bacterium]|nr:hypothetical protein [Planctomycetota bacterium]
MLQAVTLLLVLQAAPDSLTIKADLKDVPAEGKNPPVILCEGTANLPHGSILAAYLYYGEIIEGKEIFRDFSTLKAGKFTQDFPVYTRRNFPGAYIARFIYDPALQGLGAADFPRTTVDFKLQIGGPQELAAETKAVRDQLVGEIRSYIDLADQVKAKLEELKGKPAVDWEAPLKAWRDKSVEIQKRADPHRVPEYMILKLDLIADTGFENLEGILLSAARCAAGGKREIALEGLTRLRQTGEAWIGDIGAPRITEFEQMARHVDGMRTLVRKLADDPEEPVLPVRRKFLELTGVLDRSVPGDFHDAVLEIGSRGAAFFIAAADKTAEAPRIHKELDELLDRLARTLRTLK